MSSGKRSTVELSQHRQGVAAPGQILSHCQAQELAAGDLLHCLTINVVGLLDVQSQVVTVTLPHTASSCTSLLYADSSLFEMRPSTVVLSAN